MIDQREAAGECSLDPVFENPVDFVGGHYRQALAKANHPELPFLYERMTRAVGDPKYPKRLDQLKAAALNAFYALIFWHAVTLRGVHRRLALKLHKRVGFNWL
jgi:hypothetical protein